MSEKLTRRALDACSKCERRNVNALRRIDHCQRGRGANIGRRLDVRFHPPPPPTTLAGGLGIERGVSDQQKLEKRFAGNYLPNMFAAGRRSFIRATRRGAGPQRISLRSRAVDRALDIP